MQDHRNRQHDQVAELAGFQVGQHRIDQQQSQETDDGFVAGIASIKKEEG